MHLNNSRHKSNQPYFKNFQDIFCMNMDKYYWLTQVLIPPQSVSHSRRYSHTSTRSENCCDGRMVGMDLMHGIARLASFGSK